MTYFYYIFPVQAVSEWYYRRTLLTKKKTAIFANARAKGHVHPFDLIITSLDPLRQEAAPFTGIYYQFLTKNKTQAEEELKPKTVCQRYCCCFTALFSYCNCCCKKKIRDEESLKDDEIDLNGPDSEDEGDIEGGGKPFDPNKATNGEPMSWMKWFQQCWKKASPREVMNTVIAATTTSKSEKKQRAYIKYHDKLDGWEITDMGFDFEVKVKKWPKTSKSKDSNAIRLKGQHKKTFEVVNDFRCNTYHMSGIPNYALVYSYIYNQEIDNDGVLVAVEGVSRRNQDSVLDKRQKVYSYVDYYLSNWKKENYHKIFHPDRIEQELVKFDEKQKEKQQQDRDKRKNTKQASRVLPFNDDDTNSYASGGGGDALSNASSSPRRKSVLGRGSSYNSQPSNEEEETKSSASAEMKNLPKEDGNEEKKEETKAKNEPEKPEKKKRTFVIDENEEESEESEEEESEEGDDDDDDEDDESEEETDDESEEEEEESEEESGEEDDEEEEEEEGEEEAK